MAELSKVGEDLRVLKGVDVMNNKTKILGEYFTFLHTLNPPAVALVYFIQVVWVRVNIYVCLQ